MAVSTSKINGGLKTTVLAIALIANGIAVGVYYGRTEERLASIDERLRKIEASVDDRYRGADAGADFSIRDKRIDRVERKLDDHIESDD